LLCVGASFQYDFPRPRRGLIVSRPAHPTRAPAREQNAE